mmetsp:Transcript_58590/g.141434  ORF Transcript_58590/g.141434 Transcript_58590/m.141434 type:complete len:286 (-) Transcript_58590:2-859(-)
MLLDLVFPERVELVAAPVVWLEDLNDPDVVGEGHELVEVLAREGHAARRLELRARDVPRAVVGRALLVVREGLVGRGNLGEGLLAGAAVGVLVWVPAPGQGLVRPLHVRAFRVPGDAQRAVVVVHGLFRPVVPRAVALASGDDRAGEHENRHEAYGYLEVVDKLQGSLLRAHLLHLHPLLARGGAVGSRAGAAAVSPGSHRLRQPAPAPAGEAEHDEAVGPAGLALPVQELVVVLLRRRRLRSSFPTGAHSAAAGRFPRLLCGRHGLRTPCRPQPCQRGQCSRWA